MAAGAHPGLGQRGDGGLDTGRSLGRVGFGPVGHVDCADPRVPAFGHLECSGERGDHRRVSVIAVVGDDDTLVAGAGARHAERQLARLGARAAERHAREIVGEGGGERLGIVEDLLVQITGREIERPGLPAERVHHMGMAMADMGHVVVGVEIGPALAVPDPDPLPSHQVERPVVEERCAGAEQPVPAFKQRIVGHDGNPRLPAGGAQSSACSVSLGFAPGRGSR